MNKAAKHTPGPWQVRDVDPTQVCDGDGEVRGCAPIASCDHGAIRERKANALLIAAAPELLESLEAVLSSWKIVCSANGWDSMELQEHRAAVAIIAKARGQV